MKLALVMPDGTVVTVTDCLEKYDLDKPLARADLIECIKITLEEEGVS